ncbi:MAG: di/tricarboxylate transporter [Planctomycetota bacterium]|jgi:di/tricarboxylate transporter
MDSLSTEQIIVLGTLAASLLLFLTERLRYDAVAILVVLVLAGTGCLTPEAAFAGFSSKAVVLIGSMYVFSAAMERAGITGWIAKHLVAGGPQSESSLAMRLTLVSGLLSSVLSNAGVVGTLIPVVGTLSRQSGIPVSRLLIPMSFGSLLGGMLTLIGTSKNIAVNEAIEKAGAVPFGLFEFSAFGLVLLGIGALYFLGPGRALLPKRRRDATLAEHYQVPKFVTEILVEPNSSLVDKTVSQIDLQKRFSVTVLGLIRAQGKGTLMVPSQLSRIRKDDVLILRGEPEAILRMRGELNLTERQAVKVGPTQLVADDVQLVEAVVPATSHYVGATLKDLDFRALTNINCLAISKHGDVQPTKVHRTRIDIGDTLLLQGHVADIWRQHRTRELIILAEHQNPRVGHKAFYTLLMLALFLISSATGFLPLSVASLGAAVGLVLLRCVRPDDVRRTMNWSVLILIGGMLALGQAFHEHGLDRIVAHGLNTVCADFSSPVLLVAIMLFATAFLTQVVNHVAAAVLMAPIALELATEMGINDRMLLMAVLTGSGFAFLSPVAHQANTMIMGPGDYKFSDFLKVGAPLLLILGTAASFLIPLFWPA